MLKWDQTVNNVPRWRCWKGLALVGWVDIWQGKYLSYEADGKIEKGRYIGSFDELEEAKDIVERKVEPQLSN